MFGDQFNPTPNPLYARRLEEEIVAMRRALKNAAILPIEISDVTDLETTLAKIPQLPISQSDVFELENTLQKLQSLIDDAQPRLNAGDNITIDPITNTISARNAVGSSIWAVLDNQTNNVNVFDPENITGKRAYALNSDWEIIATADPETHPSTNFTAYFLPWPTQSQLLIVADTGQTVGEVATFENVVFAKTAIEFIETGGITRAQLPSELILALPGIFGNPTDGSYLQKSNSSTGFGSTPPQNTARFQIAGAWNLSLPSNGTQNYVNNSLTQIVSAPGISFLSATNEIQLEPGTYLIDAQTRPRGVNPSGAYRVALRILPRVTSGTINMGENLVRYRGATSADTTTIPIVEGADVITTTIMEVTTLSRIAMCVQGYSESNTQITISGNANDPNSRIAIRRIL